LVFFYAAHVLGVRWFSRFQVAMCALLGVSIVVLVVPGIFAIHYANYQPFFTHGLGGFAASLPPLFFAYAGFESLAQAAGEVKDSTRKLPRIFGKGILATAAIYLAMSLVAFGVLPGTRLRTSSAPMTEVGSAYLPVGAAWFVGLGALMAISTSLNMTMLVPSRLGMMLAQDRLAPKWLGAIEPRTGTPVRGLTLTLLASASLVISNQVSLALNIAVFALVALYFLHSLALLLLPRMNPNLFRTITVRTTLGVQRLAALASMLAMGGLLLVQVREDIQTLIRAGFRMSGRSLTTLELCLYWSVLGGAIYLAGRRSGARDLHDYRAALRRDSASGSSAEERSAGLPAG
jgi:amino acid transporter